VTRFGELDDVRYPQRGDGLCIAHNCHELRRPGEVRCRRHFLLLLLRHMDFLNAHPYAWQRKHQMAQTALVAVLVVEGELVREDVICRDRSRVDVVTPTAIYEVKPVLDERAVRQAVRQLAEYRTALGAHLETRVAGEWCPATPSQAAMAAAVGVRVVEVSVKAVREALRREVCA